MKKLTFLIARVKKSKLMRLKIIWYWWRHQYDCGDYKEGWWWRHHPRNNPIFSWKSTKPISKNLLVGCTSTEFNVDTNKDVLFLDKIMDVVPNKETSALFTPFVIKLKQICNRGHATLHNRIKTNHEVKRIIKSGNNDKSVAAHEGNSLNHLDLNVLDIDKDRNILAFFLCMQARFINLYVWLLSICYTLNLPTSCLTFRIHMSR